MTALIKTFMLFVSVQQVKYVNLKFSFLELPAIKNRVLKKSLPSLRLHGFNMEQLGSSQLFSRIY
jgi:hypothetical protein